MLRDWIIRWWCRRKLKQQHVDFSFSSSELTLSIEDFSRRYIDPAIEQLSAEITAEFTAEYGHPAWYKRVWFWLCWRLPWTTRKQREINAITARALSIMHQKLN